LQGEADGVHPPESSAHHAAFFAGRYERRVLPRIGHNPPQEDPASFVAAVLELMQS
jgi:pimeloyl-ACP methyl ester carboxylesterase